MAAQDFPAFEQFLNSRQQADGADHVEERQLTIQTLGPSGAPEKWVHIAHDALGLLVKKSTSLPGPTTFIPWTRIIAIE